MAEKFEAYDKSGEVVISRHVGMDIVLVGQKEGIMLGCITHVFCIHGTTTMIKNVGYDWFALDDKKQDEVEMKCRRLCLHVVFVRVCVCAFDQFILLCN